MSLMNGEFRKTARDALKADPRFETFQSFAIWDKRINGNQLPGVGVGIPRWSIDRHDTFTSGEAVATIIVAVKRVGAGLEDLADEDAEAISRILRTALEGEKQELSLVEASYQEDAQGEADVSTLSLMFTVKHWPAVE